MMRKTTDFIFNYFIILFTGILIIFFIQHYIPIQNKFIEKTIIFLFMFIIPYSYIAIYHILRKRKKRDIYNNIL